MKIAVFASGGGTNFQSILDAVEAGSLPAEVVLLVSDRQEAGALERARRHGVQRCVVDPDGFAGAAGFGRALLDALEARDADLVALAGYLRKIPPGVVDRFSPCIVNVHPALLPAFGGKGMYGHRVHEAVLDYGARWTGVTVHVVDERYDHGPVLQQVPVPVRPQEEPDELAERVLRIEHRLYPETLRLFAEEKIDVEGRTVRIAEHPPPDRRIAGLDGAGT